MKLEATFDLSTPCFHENAGGGINARGKTVHALADTLRPPALKGAMAFWWRAAEWPGIAADPTLLDSDRRLAELAKRQGRLFGAPAASTGGGQGLCGWHVRSREVKLAGDVAALKDAGWPSSDDWLGYLAGPARLLEHGAIVSANVAVTCRIRAPATEAEVHSVARALWLLGTLGGVGARHRRGWGSLSLHKLTLDGKPFGDELAVPTSAESLKHSLQTLMTLPAGSSRAEPPFTAFSPLARIDISALNTNESSSLELMQLCGKQMALYRSVGKDRLVGNRARLAVELVRGQPRFKADHDLAYDIALNLAGPHYGRGFRRASFGAPHPYYLSRANARLSLEPVMRTEDGDEVLRRASALAVHVHRFPDKTGALVQSLLPAEYLPDGAELRVRLQHERQDSFTQSRVVDWSVVSDYLDRTEFTGEPGYTSILPTMAPALAGRQQ